MIQSIFSKKSVPSYLVSLVLLYILHFLFFTDLTFFLFLIYGIKGIMGLVVITIAIHTYKISRNTIFTFLAISLGFCGVIDCLAVVFSYHYNLSDLLSEHIYLQIFVDYLNIFSLVLFFKLHNKKINLKYVFLLYFIIVLSFLYLIISSLFVFKLFPSHSKIVILNFSIRDILNLSLFIFSLYPLYAFNNIKNDIKDNDLKSIFSLWILFIISMLLFFLSFLEGGGIGIFGFIANIVSLFYLFFVFKVILNSVLRKPYEILFYDLDKKSKEVQEINNYYEVVIESLPLAIIVICNNKISFTNISTLEFLGYKSKSDLYDMNLYDILDDKSIRDCAYNIYNKSESFETTFKKSNGDLFDTEVIPIDVIFHDTECTMLIVKDISSKKKVRELSKTLEQKMLEEKMQTEFFSNVSHELRTPINVIYSVLQLEDIYIKNGDLESIAKHNKTLKQNCLRLLRICNNLIDSSKIEAGYFIPDMKCENMVSLIENIVSSVSSYTSIKNMTITFDTDSENIYSVCDSDLIERIILNLISNSIKYGSEGGDISVDMYDKGDLVKIVFKDDGPGIPEEKCEDIFKRFIQVDKSFSRPSEGSGVGLSLVKSLIDLHDGTIEIESDEGLGCKFTIMLPAVKYHLDEIAATSDSYLEHNSIVDKIDIEFSDIYF